MTFNLERLGRRAFTLATSLAVLGVMGAQDLQAQRRGAGFRGQGGMLRGGPGGGVERTLRLADEIELSGDQRAELEAIRQELVRARADEMVRMLELTSEVRAGLREPEALREALRGQRDAMDERVTATSERVDAVLTEAQRERLDELDARRGAWREGGRGWRGRRGGPPGLRRMQRNRPGA